MIVDGARRRHVGVCWWCRLGDSRNKLILRLSRIEVSGTGGKGICRKRDFGQILLFGGFKMRVKRRVRWRKCVAGRGRGRKNWY